MLIRIVKMSFKTEEISVFLDNFNNNKLKIRNFKGCRLLELYRDQNDSDIFFSYSYWDNEEALMNYRNSKLFRSIWEQTKVLFNKDPEAWSVEKLASLK